MLDPNMTVEFILSNTIRYHDTAYVAVCENEECIAPRLREFWKNNIISGYVFLANTSSLDLYGFEPAPEDILVLKKPSVTSVSLNIINRKSNFLSFRLKFLTYIKAG